MRAELQHFLFSGIAARASVDSAMKKLKILTSNSKIEQFSDVLIKDYITSPPYEDRLLSEKMSGYYKLFYLLENEIRSFIVDMLSTESGEDWWIQNVPESVRNNADKNLQREIREGVIPRSDRMIDYTTFGELSEIIKANWKIFGGVFTRHDAVGVERVLSQLNMLRSPIAHCGILAEDDVVKLKLVVRNWYRLLE